MTVMLESKLTWVEADAASFVEWQEGPRTHSEELLVRSWTFTHTRARGLLL